ncbi:MAG: hypothetical protein HY000_16505 [Planctomycetes bacterium]|nr:hypothetical protein [Planctomycetota bacterium]
MTTPSDLFELLETDRRYAPRAYAFVLEALRHAQVKLGRMEQPEEKARHVTAKELLDALRDLATEQFGLLAVTVLNGWGVRSTSDVGEIVFNLVRARHMSKTESDQRRDFDEVYDFEDVFRRQFKFEIGDPEL